jgi:hypothetical protein
MGGAGVKSPFLVSRFSFPEKNGFEPRNFEVQATLYFLPLTITGGAKASSGDLAS